MNFPAGLPQDTDRVVRTSAICSHSKIAIGSETVENLTDYIKVYRQSVGGRENSSYL